MSRGEVIAAAVGLVVIVALILLLANAIRGEDVTWRVSYTTRGRTRRHRHGTDPDDDDGEEEDDG